MGLDHINMIDKIVKRITQCFSFRKCGKRVNLKGQKCINVMTVSYTHLDVYKRQAERWNPMQYYDYWREEKKINQ